MSITPTWRPRWKGCPSPTARLCRCASSRKLSYDEMAKVAGVSEDNARARVSRARSALRAALRVVAVVPVALVGLLRRGERATAAAVSGQSSPGSGRAALNSAMPMLTETAPMASRAAAAMTNAATTGVPVMAKAAVGFGLATAVITPTIDSPVHRAADRVLPDSVMEVLTPLAVELPAPDAPVIVPVAAPVTAVADLTDPAGTEVPAEAAAAPVVEEAPQETEAAASTAAAVTPVIDNDSQVAEATADGSEAIIETSVATQVVINPVTTVSSSGSVQGAELTFTPSGADRYDVAGSLSLTVTTATTTTTDGVESTETVTSTESVAVISPSSASLEAADPAVTERRFSALLVFAPGDDGASAEMRLAARGTANDDGSLAMTGFFTAAGTESLPLAERGNLSGTLMLDADGMPASLSITLTQ